MNEDTSGYVVLRRPVNGYVVLQVGGNKWVCSETVRLKDSTGLPKAL